MCRPASIKGGRGGLHRIGTAPVQKKYVLMVGHGYVAKTT